MLWEYCPCVYYKIALNTVYRRKCGHILNYLFYYLFFTHMHKTVNATKSGVWLLCNNMFVCSLGYFIFMWNCRRGCAAILTPQQIYYIYSILTFIIKYSGSLNWGWYDICSMFIFVKYSLKFHLFSWLIMHKFSWNYRLDKCMTGWGCFSSQHSMHLSLSPFPHSHTNTHSVHV